MIRCKNRCSGNWFSIGNVWHICKLPNGHKGKCVCDCGQEYSEDRIGYMRISNYTHRSTIIKE